MSARYLSLRRNTSPQSSLLVWLTGEIALGPLDLDVVLGSITRESALKRCDILAGYVRLSNEPKHSTQVHYARCYSMQILFNF